MNSFLTILQGLTNGQWKDLVSALLGAVGTGVLFGWSYAYEPYDLPTFSGPGTLDHIAGVRRRNWWRKRLQRFGLVLLFLSFIAQIVGVFLPVRVG
jgi:hypothetical protein